MMADSTEIANNATETANLTVKREENDDDKATDEYAYLEKGGFSSENFKIEVRDMPRFYGIGEFKKILRTKMKLDITKVKRPNRSDIIYICFPDEENRTKALEQLDGFQWKGRNLRAANSDPVPDPLIRKRKLEGDESGDVKRVKDDKTPDQKLKESATPYADKPYEQQLKMKELHVIDILKKFDNELIRNSRWMMKSLNDKRIQSPHGISFAVSPIQQSPIQDAYRNKCEFTVGYGTDGVPTVGFRFGAYNKGDVSVAPVNALLHISEGMKNIVKLFQDLVRASPLTPYSPITYKGCWRFLTVRESKLQDNFMVIVTVHPQVLPEEEIEDLKKQVLDHFTGESAAGAKIVSLYFQTMARGKTKAQHLWGETHIFDTIFGLKFRISPEAFFQINTAGAEVLYSSAMEMCGLNKESTTVIDVCCGTGTIGLCFAKHCHKVIGVESVEEAVKDAKSNADVNGIDNCEFFAGSAEDKLAAILDRISSDDVVAVVDPPRAGLHLRAIRTLRNAKRVKRIVYLSCDPFAAMKNFLDLSRASSKTMKGSPLLPVKAVPVDMFPHTKHVEVAVLFERVEEPQEIPENGSDIQNEQTEPEEIDFTADPI